MDLIANHCKSGKYNKQMFVIKLHDHRFLQMITYILLAFCIAAPHPVVVKTITIIGDSEKKIVRTSGVSFVYFHTEILNHTNEITR